MSQYSQSPYTTPNLYPAGYGYDPMSAYLAPARRAGLLLIIVGALIGLYSMCNGLGALLVPSQSWIESNRRIGIEEELPVETMKAFGIGFSIITGLVGIVMASLGFPVRRGSAAAHITAIVITSIVVLIAGLFFLMSLVAATQAPVMLVIAAVLVMVLVVFVLQLVWLIQGMRASSMVRTMQMQYQAQYWQYQQQQQMYAQQAGHGYAQAPQPPASEPGKG